MAHGHLENSLCSLGQWIPASGDRHPSTGGPGKTGLDDGRSYRWNSWPEISANQERFGVELRGIPPKCLIVDLIVTKVSCKGFRVLHTVFSADLIRIVGPAPRIMEPATTNRRASPTNHGASSHLKCSYRTHCDTHLTSYACWYARCVEK